MSDHVDGMAEKFKRGCIGVLVGTIAIYCAVGIIKAIWPVLVVMLGIVTLIGLVVGGIVLYRRMRAKW